MDIAQAKQHIDGAVTAYLSRDELGRLRIPFRMQRPLFLVGPPGIGKTAVVAQVAEERGLNFVSYSIAHHTRQSALGLPVIKSRTYAGRDVEISEFTMSEIVASVYDAVERSGVAEGILFLDEINCASETLAPSMLQFLQYKTFGTHALPEGWIVVCAGNPPEYNRSAREFDPSTLDRLKKIEVEPDFPAWLAYAANNRVHPAVVAYLEAKPHRFYLMRAGANGPRMVTARGWEDLSRMILAYEAEGLCVDEALVVQYLQDEETAREFAAWYALFCKRRTSYGIEAILEGRPSGIDLGMAREAAFDERVLLVNMLLDVLVGRIEGLVKEEVALKRVRDLVKAGAGAWDAEALRGRVDAIGARLADARTPAAEAESLAIERRLLEQVLLGDVEDYEGVRAAFNPIARAHKRAEAGAAQAVDHAVDFLEAAFEGDQELSIFVTRLTTNPCATMFLARHECPGFFRASKFVLIHERMLDLLQEVADVDTSISPYLQEEEINC
jgi:hypothetical protein